MTRSRLHQTRSTFRTLLRSTVAAAWLVAGCRVLTLEEQTLQRFFEASRLYDMAALEKVATVPFNPVTDGIVQDFAVVSVAVSGDVRTVNVDAQVRGRTGTTQE